MGATFKSHDFRLKKGFWHMSVLGYCHGYVQTMFLWSVWFCCACDWNSTS